MISHDFDSTPTLVPMLELAAARTPDALALQDERRALSFAALVSEIDALAAALRLRIAPGEHVAVRLPRGLEYVVAAYAIWKAGGVYVPLDDSWPQARIDAILARSNVALLIHAGATGMQFTVLPGIAYAALPVSEAPAYLIHTSGTTGTPKGVQVGHASLLHLVANHQRHLYGPHGVKCGAVALNASFCFDSSLERLALVALGYTVHVIADAVRKSPNELLRYLRDHRIVNVDLVPSHLRVLMRSGLVETASALKIVIVGGEPIEAALWQELAASRIVFFNVYGPTENTINTTFCQIQGATPNIGRPFDGVDCTIVDGNGNRCPAGDEGELWVSGRHLSLGYYNAHEANADSFVQLDGIRCYRTGDLTKSDEQGVIHFIGRIDDQVKVNGYRIELADIQHHLESVPGVRQAAVTPVKRSDGTRLLASIVGDKWPFAIPFAELALRLSESLPAYMVPDHWQAVESLPLTENLKRDHKALTQMWEQSDHTAHAGSAVRDAWRASEREVHAVWRSVLERDGFALDDHFFASGGDSLAAMNLLMELESIVSGEVELAVVFKHPTIRKMAVWLDMRRTQHQIAIGLSAS